MHVEEIELWNIGDVEYMSADFSKDSMIGLVGPNGCGKSTLLTAMRWLLTQTLPDAHPTSDRFRRVIGEEPATPSGARIRIAANGKHAEIVGLLDKSYWSLRVEGAKKVVGAKKVAEGLQDLLGADLDVIKRYGFIQQNTMRRILFAQPAERLAAFQQLIGADSAEPSRKRLQEAIEMIVAPDLTNEITAATRDVQEASMQLRGVEASISESETILRGIDIASVRAVLQRRADAASAIGAIEQLHRHLQQLEVDYVAVLEQEASLRNSAQSWAAHADKLRPLSEEAARGLVQREADLERYRQYLGMVTQLNTLRVNPPQRRAVAKVKPLPCVPGLPPQKPEAYDESIKRIPDLSLASVSAAKAYRDYSNRVIGTCPVCGTACACCTEKAGGPVDPARREELFKILEQANKEHTDAITLVAQYDAALRAFTAAEQQKQQRYDTDLAAYNAEVESIEQGFQLATLAWQASIKDAENAVAVCPVTSPPSEENVAAWKDTQKQYLEATNGVTHWSSQHAACKASRDALLTTIQREKGVLAQKQAQAAAAPTDEEFLAAQSSKELWDRHNSMLVVNYQHVTTLQRNLETRSQALMELELRQKRNARLRKFSETLTAMRAVLHRDRLPARMTARYLAIAGAKCNEILPKLRADFLTYVKGVDFYVQKSSGDKILAADLSGGQACRWIWAFIATINQMFAKDLGILGLDEPTEGLSDEGKEALKETLPHLAELLAAQRVQLFMATHEKSFSTAFGRLVNVAELRGRLTPELVEKIANL